MNLVAQNYYSFFANNKLHKLAKTNIHESIDQGSASTQGPTPRFLFKGQHLKELISKLTLGNAQAYLKLLALFEKQAINTNEFHFIIDSLARNKSQYAKDFLHELTNKIPQHQQRDFNKIIAKIDPNFWKELFNLQTPQSILKSKP